MNPANYTTCAWCPRLCRHVCPVAVATGLEAATPTAMMSAPLLAERGDLDPAELVAGTSLCLDCGACTAHCKVHVPVAERLRPWREAVPAAALEPIRGDARVVCVLTGPDWSAALGAPVATLHTADELGHAAWRHGDTAVLARVTAHFSGREVVTASAAVAEVLTAAGVPVRRLPAPEADLVFTPCFDGPRTSPDQLACCGRRDGFAHREPAAARAVAEENVRRFDGRRVACADEACAAWLREHGARVVAPSDALVAGGERDDA